MGEGAKYLRVTIHDNDFSGSLRMVCETFYEICCEEEMFPGEEDFPTIQRYLSQIWCGVDNTMDLLRWKNTITPHHPTDIAYLAPKLCFVDFQEIPDWDNYESAYIPMFDGAEVLMR